MVELYAERKRLEEMEAAEAEGASFWTDQFEDRVQVKIEFAVDDTAGKAVPHM